MSDAIVGKARDCDGKGQTTGGYEIGLPRRLNSKQLSSRISQQFRKLTKFNSSIKNYLKSIAEEIKTNLLASSQPRQQDCLDQPFSKQSSLDSNSAAVAQVE
jgi:hypothetical protein